MINERETIIGQYVITGSVNQILTARHKKLEMSPDCFLILHTLVATSKVGALRTGTGSVWLLSILAGKSEQCLTDIFDEIFHSQACLRLVQFVILSSHFSLKTDNCLELKNGNYSFCWKILIYTSDR